MSTFLLILHGLMAVALLGTITHQAAAITWRRTTRSGSFIDRYTRVNENTYVMATVVLYAGVFILGAIIYPNYRLNVRIPFEEMSLGWAIGLFELKEHFGGLGLCLLPMYAYTWRPENVTTHRGDRLALTFLLAFIVWWDFLVGHVLNNIRGLA